MDIQKTIIYIGLFFVSLMLWAEWQKEQSERLDKPSATLPSRAPKVQGNITKEISTTKEVKRAPLVSNSPKKPVVSATSFSNDYINITTDLLDLKIDTIGGAIVSATLNEHLVDINSDENYQLFNENDSDLYLAEMGFIQNGSALSKVKFISENKAYKLEGDTLIVKLSGILSSDVYVERTYKFTKGLHSIEVNTVVTNSSNNEWAGQMYYQLVRKEKEAKSGMMIGMNSYTGASISDPNNKLYEKVSFKDMHKKQLQRDVEGGWVAMQEHYFLSSFIPAQGTNNTFYSQEYADKQFAIGFSTNNTIIKSGDSHNFATTLYVGPEYGEELKELSDGLELTIDYGWLWFISGILFFLLKYIHNFVNNWGWSIILLTFLIKLVFYKLSSASYRSMAGMKKFQPKIQALKDKFGDDKAQMNKAVMELYRKEKINPLGGCLPILVQIPVFISLYWVLLESVELRHSPFILWIHDLSSRDPYYILPIMMGASMFLQQRLSPPPSDPIQAKVMQFVPVMLTFLFISVPAGLVLYWTVNNVLSILQQWYITKSMEVKS